MKSSKEAGHDGISKLPDDVLCHIFSFLTTKEAIATSLLSIRWRFLWRMAISLHIHCSKPIMKHYQRVDTFMGLLRTPKITHFHLRCDDMNDCCSFYVQEWVSAVIARKVKHVNISLRRCNRYHFSLDALFNCTTLVTLKVDGRFDLTLPSSSSFCLPNLKTMLLHVNTCISGRIFLKLIVGSPYLELFHLKCRQPCSLTQMKIFGNSQGTTVFHTFLIPYIVIHHQNCIFISDSANCRWKNKNIESTKFYMTVSNCKKHILLNESISEILKDMERVEFMSLGDFREEVDPSILDIPVFQNLVELRLFLKNSHSSFLKISAKCPKLEVLEVHIMDDRNCINQRCRYGVSGGVWKLDLSIVPFTP